MTQKRKERSIKMLGNINLAAPGNSRYLKYASPKSLLTGGFAELALQEEAPSPSARTTTSEKGMTLNFETSDGKKGELHWSQDMLASIGGNGGTVNARYHQDSTEDDPIAVIWGTDSAGRSYETVVHLNDVDPRHASPGEMIALNAHLSRINGKNDASPIALWASTGVFGADSKTDYQSYYNDYIAMQKQAGNQAGARLYQIQMERFLFSVRQAAEKA